MPQAPNPNTATDQLEAGGQVAGAAVEAAAAQPTPAKARVAARKAARETAQKVQIELSEEDAELLANALIDQMEARGAFTPPPEQVAPPAPPVAAPAGGQPVEVVEHPRGESFAEKFRSRR